MLSVNEGDDAHFQCIVSGTPQPTLTWFYGSIPLPNPTLPRFSLGTNHTLILSEVSHDTDEGLTVVCQATNIAGTESAILTVDVNCGYYKLMGVLPYTVHVQYILYVRIQ